jgi:iron complex transport system substrate-binding protein
MWMTHLPKTVLPIALIGFLTATSTTSFADTGFPVSIENCGIVTTYSHSPKRAFTMNQAATEIMLALGLQDRMVGTAFLDDAILAEFADAYKTIQVKATGYPSRDELLEARPDFVYAAYPSAFSEEVDGMRDLLRSGAGSYLSPSGCEGRDRSSPASFEAVFGEIRDIGRIFGVLPRAEQLIASYRADLVAIRDRIGTVNTPVRVLWYDSGAPPFVGACCGAPNEILRLAGAQNIFGDVRGSWATVSWDEVVARNPEVVVLVNSSWSLGSQKRQWLSAIDARAGIDAVKHQRFVTIDFSSSTPGIRNIAAVRRLAESLYPEKFK